MNASTSNHKDNEEKEEEEEEAGMKLNPNWNTDRSHSMTDDNSNDSNNTKLSNLMFVDFYSAHVIVRDFSVVLFEHVLQVIRLHPHNRKKQFWEITEKIRSGIYWL